MNIINKMSFQIIIQMNIIYSITVQFCLQFQKIWGFTETDQGQLRGGLRYVKRHILLQLQFGATIKSFVHDGGRKSPFGTPRWSNLHYKHERGIYLII